jgi:hypothetical protein
MVVQPINARGYFLTFELGNDGLPNTSFFVGILFNGNDIADNLVDNKVLINVNAIETTEAIGDAQKFVEDAQEKTHNNIIICSVHQCMTRNKQTQDKLACQR